MVCLSFFHYTSLCISCDKNLKEFLMLCFVLWASCYSFLSIKLYVCTWIDLLFVNRCGLSNLLGQFNLMDTNYVPMHFNFHPLVLGRRTMWDMPHQCLKAYHQCSWFYIFLQSLSLFFPNILLFLVLRVEDRKSLKCPSRLTSVPLLEGIMILMVNFKLFGWQYGANV